MASPIAHVLSAGRMHFSARTTYDPSPNALYEALLRARAHDVEGLPLYDLTVANPTAVALPYDASALQQAFAQADLLAYEPASLGSLAVRAQLATLLQSEQREDGAARADVTAIGADHIFLTASTSEAYGILFKLLCDPGDSVLVPTPSYPLFDYLARFEAVELVPYPYRYDGAWYIDPADLRSRITDRTRAILLVSPNNPTGHCLKPSELEGLLDLGLPLLIDEVFDAYRLLTSSAAANVVARGRAATRGLVFSLHGLSKYAALPQMKLAWTCVAGDSSLTHESLLRLELLLDAYLSVGTPVQAALPALLASATGVRSAIRERTAANLQLLIAQCMDTAITVLHVEAGWYATLRLPALHSDEEWALKLLAEARVYVHPGSFFGFTGAPHIVVSLLTSPLEFAPALRAILRVVDAEIA